MQQISKIFELKTYILAAIAVISFSNFIVLLFGQTIPGIIVTFFRHTYGMVILAAVFFFALLWFLKARQRNRLKSYSVVVFDVYGRKSEVKDIRTEFKRHDVAWSFMKKYKKSYPLCNFAMVSKLSKSDKPTIFRYI